MRPWQQLVRLSVVACSFAVSAGAALQDDAPAGKFCRVVDGKVDAQTYNGFRRYHSSCNHCHGPDGIGSTFGPALIDIMTASAAVRHAARDYLWFVIASPLLAVFAFAFDGVYIGATWARDMRNLMVLSLFIFLTAWLALRSFGNAGLWGALLFLYAARGGLEALRYPALLRGSFEGKG